MRFGDFKNTLYFCSQKSVRNFGFYDARKVGVLPDTLTNPILYDMSIRVKAKQTLMGVGENKGKYRFLLTAIRYNTLSADKVIQEAALRSGLPKASISAGWNAIGDVVMAWATEGHSVAVPGLGHLQFKIRAKSVENVEDVASSLITSRRVNFVPNTEIKQALQNTSVNIECYDKDGLLIKNVTSKDKNDVEDTTDENLTENEGEQGSNAGDSDTTGGGLG